MIFMSTALGYVSILLNKLESVAFFIGTNDATKQIFFVHMSLMYNPQILFQISTIIKE